MSKDKPQEKHWAVFNQSVWQILVYFQSQNVLLKYLAAQVPETLYILRCMHKTKTNKATEWVHRTPPLEVNMQIEPKLLLWKSRVFTALVQNQFNQYNWTATAKVQKAAWAQKKCKGAISSRLQLPSIKVPRKTTVQLSQ